MVHKMTGNSKSLKAEAAERTIRQALGVVALMQGKLEAAAVRAEGGKESEADAMADAAMLVERLLGEVHDFVLSAMRDGAERSMAALDK